VVTSQQDGVPLHRLIHTLAIPQTDVPDFIKMSNWPSNAPDLNPVDYSISDALQHLMYWQKFKNIDRLK